MPQPITADFAKQLANGFKHRRDLLVIGEGAQFHPLPPAKKRIRLAQSNRSLTQI